MYLFSQLLRTEKSDVNPTTNSKQDIVNSIQNLTNTIHSAMDNSSYVRYTKKYRTNIPTEIQQEICAENRLRRELQRTRYPYTKRSLNAKIVHIRLMLQTHRQDEWDMYLNSLNDNVNLIYEMNRSLLRRKPATHLILGTNGPVYLAQDKTEIFAESLEQQFSTIPGPLIPEFAASIFTLKRSEINRSNIFTSPCEIQKQIDILAKNKAPGKDQITNTALKYLPKRHILQLTKIINDCFKPFYFPTIWKLSSIISIPKPGKNHQLPESLDL
jgi:hypothetical protein